MTSDSPWVLSLIDPTEVQDLTRALVDTPTRNGLEPEQPAAELLADVLSDAGLDAELRFVEDGRPNLLATLRGRSDEPALMLNGHLDTMALSMDWTEDQPTTLEGDILRGHGARNMKGGLAALVLAAAAIGRSGIDLGGTLIVAGVMGHLEGGRGSRALIAEGLVPDYAIFPEPTGLGIRTVQAGTLPFRVAVIGRSAPAGPPSLFRSFGSPESIPTDARVIAQAVVDAICQTETNIGADPDMPALPILHVRGLHIGYGRDLIPAPFVSDHAIVEMTAFCGRGTSPEEILQEIETMVDVVRAAHPRARITITPAGQFRPALAVPESSRVVEVLRLAHRNVTAALPKVGPVPPSCYFGCDAQIFAEVGVEAVSYGPANHAYEWDNRGRVNLADVMTCARVLTSAALGLLCSGPEEKR
jgi:acetylornithine deacetylase